MDDPRNQDGIGPAELLAVSFGTSYNDNREKTIGAVEAALEAAFPEYDVRRGFTSRMIIKSVFKRDGVLIDGVEEALRRAEANGVRTLIVQPTHLMDGIEYHETVSQIEAHRASFDKIVLSAPLLSSDDDLRAVAKALTDACREYDDGRTALCFMGHGTEAASNAVYGRMQRIFREMGRDDCFIGTVEAEPTVADLAEMVRAGGFRRVVLRPLMLVAGDHANNDMAGDDPGSWKNVFTAAGYDVVCVLEGLGSLDAIQELYVRHVREALEKEQLL